MFRFTAFASIYFINFALAHMPGGASAAEPIVVSDDEEEGGLPENAPLITPLAMVPRGKMYTPDLESVTFLTDLLENMVKQAHFIAEQGWAPFSDFLDSFFDVMDLLERLNRSWAGHCVRKVHSFRRSVELIEELQSTDLEPEIEKTLQALRSEAGAAALTAEELRAKAATEVRAKNAARIAQARAHLASFSLREPPFYIR